MKADFPLSNWPQVEQIALKASTGNGNCVGNCIINQPWASDELHVIKFINDIRSSNTNRCPVFLQEEKDKRRDVKHRQVITKNKYYYFNTINK